VIRQLVGFTEFVVVLSEENNPSIVSDDALLFDTVTPNLLDTLYDAIAVINCSFDEDSLRAV